MVGFNYVIEMAPDKKYGAPDPETGEWNGVVRQILEKVPHSFERIPRSIVLTLPIIAATFEFSKVMTQIPIAESWFGRRIDDNQLRSRDGDWLYQAVYEPWHKHPV